MTTTPTTPRSAEFNLRQAFKNNSDCYADTWRFENDGGYSEGEVIQAMTEDAVVKLFSEHTAALQAKVDFWVNAWNLRDKQASQLQAENERLRVELIKEDDMNLILLALENHIERLDSKWDGDDRYVNPADKYRELHLKLTNQQEEQNNG